MKKLGSAVGSTARFLGRGFRDLLSSFLWGLGVAIVRLSLFALVLSASSFAIAARGSVFRGALAAGIAILSCIAFGSVVSIRRALLYALVTAAEKQRIAGRIAATILDGLLGGTEEGAKSRVARSVERIPLAQATELLRDAIRTRVGETRSRRWLFGILGRRLERSLLRLVERVALDRFRADAEHGGGVDLLKVRNELNENADRWIVDLVRRPLAKLTWILASAAALASLGAAFALRQIG